MLSQVNGEEAIPPHLLENLGSEEFAIRENAQEDLLAWALEHPKPIIPKLLRISQEDDDPEVRKRSFAVLKALGEADYLADGQGYLGILMQEEPLGVAQDGKNKFGIRILEVMKGSPADNAELRMGDLIVSLDGKEWEEIGAVTAFSKSIAEKKPLVEILLMVRKDQAEPIGVTVKLGKRPTPDLRVGGDLGQLEEMAKEKHFKEWLKKQQEE
jgi:S1-C subfamily serine protease